MPPKYSNEELRFLFRPSGSSVSSTKDQIKNTPLHELERMIPAKSYPKKVEIIKRIYSEHRDDLVLLELDPSSSEVKNNEFYDFSKLGIKKPTETELLYLYGFPAELTRDVGFNRYGTLPYSLSSVLTHKELDLDLFAPEREFLIEYVLNDADSVKPYGLSGCGVWKRIPAGEGIWTSDVYLTGVQKSVLLKRDVLVATAGHVIEELMSKI